MTAYRLQVQSVTYCLHCRSCRPLHRRCSRAGASARSSGSQTGQAVAASRWLAAQRPPPPVALPPSMRQMTMTTTCTARHLTA